MSALIAFIIVASLAILTLLTVFVLKKFKYIIWSDWFRAIIITEDGRKIQRTFRLKNSDSQFVAKIDGQLDTYFIIAKEDVDHAKLKKLAREEKVELNEEIPSPVNHPSNRRVFRDGRFRIPVAFYNAHQAEPIDIQNMRKYSLVSATRHTEIARNTVTSQLLTAFADNPMREAVAFMLGAAIILGSIVLLGFYLNSRIEEILDAIG